MIYAQKPADFELWPGAGYKLKIDKHFRTDAVVQFRINDTISSIKSALTEVGLKYRLNKYFAFRGAYRYTARPLKNDRQRFSLEALFSWSKKKFPLSARYRLRFQDTQELNSRKKSTYLRNKVGAKYNLSKLVDPFVAYEIYYRFNKKNEFRVSRFTAGLDWRITKKIHLSTFYRIQDDINVKKPKRRHIIGIQVGYNMKIKKKKKSKASN